MKNSIHIKNSTIYKFMLPGFLLYVFAMVCPIIICFAMSLLNWSGGPNMEFVGLNNYKYLLKDDTFWLSFFNNLKFMGILIFTQIGAAFIIALLFQSKLIKCKEFHRRVIFLPVVLSSVVVGMVWQLVLRQNIGIIASILAKIGLEKYALPWLDDTKLIIISISMALTWQFIGQYVVIFTAGMQNIDPAVLEAAEIDGANSYQRATKIIFPLLKPTISVCFILCVSGCMKLFDHILIISGGGPGKASMVTALYSYYTAFTASRIGYASSISIGMLLLSLSLIVLVRLVFARGESDE